MSSDSGRVSSPDSPRAISPMNFNNSPYQSIKNINLHPWCSNLNKYLIGGLLGFGSVMSYNYLKNKFNNLNINKPSTDLVVYQYKPTPVNYVMRNSDVVNYKPTPHSNNSRKLFKK